MEDPYDMSTDTNEPNETKARKKGGGVVKAAAAVLLSGCLIASLGLNVYQAAVQNRKVSEYIDRELERQAEAAKQENQYMEDGYKVGGEYGIRSTARRVSRAASYRALAGDRSRRMSHTPRVWNLWIRKSIFPLNRRHTLSMGMKGSFSASRWEP